MTPTQETTLRLLTLDLISPARRVEQSQVDALTPADWAEILRMARQHRIGPMMRWQLQHAHAHLRVPPDVAAALDQQFRHWTVRMMMIQRELLRVHGILEAAGIPHVALKGAHLAYCVYPHPALRPVRDLDILISRDRLMDAREVLLAGGLTASERFEHTPASIQDNQQHLPPLLSGAVSVELHRRVLHLGQNHQIGEDLADDPTYWQRCVTCEISGHTLKFPSAPDQFLHLMVHAMYDHSLMNGPLLLSDLGFLAQESPLDWPALHDAAHQRGFGRGFDLTCALLRQYWGAPTPPEPNAGSAHTELPESVRHSAPLLMLREQAANSDAAVLRELRESRSFAAKLKVLLRAACPPRAIISYVFAVREDSPWIWLWYPAWWWRHASRRLKPLLRGRRPYVLAAASETTSAFEEWLRPDRPAPPSPFRAR